MRKIIAKWVLVLLAVMEMIIVLSMPASALQASFTASKTQGPAPLIVTFEPSVSGGIQPYHFNWTFGDGQVSSERAPTHTFTSSGSYTVTLMVTCSCNPPTSVYYSQIITVGSSNSDITSSFSATPSSGIAPLNVSFASKVSGGAPPYAYEWNFGDGKTSKDANPIHRYPIPGTYSVQLNVSNPNSAASTSTQIIVVRSPPQVRVSAEAGIGVASL